MTMAAMLPTSMTTSRTRTTFKRASNFGFGDGVLLRTSVRQPISPRVIGITEVR